MRGNIHHVVPACHFVDETADPQEASTLYQWGTKTAIRRFCKTCGILPWYVPRSNPDSIGVTINCVDWTLGGTITPPKIEIVKFDGVHWDDTMKDLEEKKTKSGT